MRLLEVRNLEIQYPVQRRTFGRRGALRAVDKASFSIEAGETLGLVGESGCGKSSVARSLALLEKPAGGQIRFKGRSILGLNAAERRAYRRSVQMIFQDPHGSLNPKRTAGASIAEGIEVQGLLREPDEVREEVLRLLEMVGLGAGDADRYPREFSGGQRQRIGIARALAVRPELVICDEPVSALDVSVQAQVIRLLRELQANSGLSYLFITHDLAVVERVSRRVMVMYLGQIMEQGPASEVIGNPLHPYSRLLAASIPGTPKRRLRSLQTATGDLPSPLETPVGCPFHSRCPHVENRCRQERPLLKSAAPKRQVACHFVEEIQRKNAGETE